MKTQFKLIIILLFSFPILSCTSSESTSSESTSSESTFDQQVNSCVKDVKIGLGDPNSLELVSTEGSEIDDGSFRVNLNFTAKNATGGRVRGNSICGFTNKNSIELNSEDFINKERKLARDLKGLGVL